MDRKGGQEGMRPRRRLCPGLHTLAPEPRKSLPCLLAALLCALLISGCSRRTAVCPYPGRHTRAHYRAHHSRVRAPKPSRVIVQRVAYFDAPRTIYHEVGPGDSMLRICRMYGVSSGSIRRKNHLGRKQSLQPGQMIIIPSVRTIRYVINLYRTRPWSYIIVHHTATEAGDATTIQRAHLQRGFWNGLGYDFVIDNGTMGRGDGVIEMSPRWLRQETGAHCKADSMNRRAIGIALVGNFDCERPSRYQLESLAYLIYILRHYYDIPSSNVMGHGQVPGARTDCPGRLFPINFLKQAARR